MNAYFLFLLLGVLQSADPTPARSIKIVLAGDSTVTDQAGWGLGFASALKPTATCVNLSAGGRSSKSFRNEGRWKQVLEQKPNVILIQFGHNDQPGKVPIEKQTRVIPFRITCVAM